MQSVGWIKEGSGGNQEEGSDEGRHFFWARCFCFSRATRLWSWICYGFSSIIGSNVFLDSINFSFKCIFIWSDTKFVPKQEEFSLVTHLLAEIWKGYYYYPMLCHEWVLKRWTIFLWKYGTWAREENIFLKEKRKKERPQKIYFAPGKWDRL